MKSLILDAEWAPRTKMNTPETGVKFASMACNAWRNPRLVMKDIPTPTPGAHDVVIDVKACGICGSDTHCIETDDDDYVIFSGPAAFPCALGHEFAGRVVEVGAAVKRVKIGDLVTAEGMLYCGECSACTAGHVNQCHHLKMMGFSHPGAFSDAVVLHEKHCWSINGLAEGLGDEQRACEIASLVEPVGCAQNGMFVVGPGVGPESHVAVFGAGPIGLGAIALARAAGAASITAFDRTEGRLALAKTMGADHVHNVDAMLPEEAAEAIREASGGWGADMVVEAAGAAHHTMPICEAAIAPGATIVYLGRTGERAPVMLDVLVSNAARIIGARGHAGFGIFPHIIDMLERETLDLQPMITHTTQLSDYERAFERSRSREDGKILLVQP